MTDDPSATAQQYESLLEALRLYGSTFNRFGRRFAQWAGMHATDGEALMEIVYAEDRSAPLSPSRLAELVQLSSGATTALIDRLERGGHVVRRREGLDRRAVTLHTGSHVHEMADEFFGPLGHRLADTLDRYPPEVLAQFHDLLDDIRRTMSAALDDGDYPKESPHP